MKLIYDKLRHEIEEEVSAVMTGGDWDSVWSDVWRGIESKVWVRVWQGFARIIKNELDKEPYYEKIKHNIKYEVKHNIKYEVRDAISPETGYKTYSIVLDKVLWEVRNTIWGNIRNAVKSELDKT